MLNDVSRFFQEIRVELSKVVWPQSEEFVGATVIVLMLVCLFGIYLGAVDWLLGRMVLWLLGG